MSAYQRQKGKRGEREVCAILRAAGYAVERGWQSKSGTIEPDVKGLPGIWPEVGFGRSINPRAKLAQAIEACGTDDLPIAVTRGAGRGDAWVVTMELDTFIARVLPLLIDDDLERGKVRAEEGGKR